MNGDTLYTIGELARKTGLSVKTIRFYSDRGIVTPTDRNPAGYRLYDADAVARLDLVRTLRELGLDLATVRRIVDRELSLPEVAAAHADALAVQIRTLRLRRAVLTAVAERGSSPEEMGLMYSLAKLSDDERRQLIGEFLDDMFVGVRDAPVLAAVERSLTPELPDHPRAEQVQAWVELAGLSQDPGFRALIRRMAEDEASEHTQGDGGLRRDFIATVRAEVAPALLAGIGPATAQAEPIVTGLTARYTEVVSASDDNIETVAETELRRRLLTRLEIVNDPRREQYLELLAVINDWPAPESLTPVLDWFIEALQARAS
jgi:DNA-binding transcriptional MerR regulator